MEIDWNTAPEWAKGHGLVVQGSIKQVWYGDFSYMVVGDSRAYPFGGGSGETRHNHAQGAIQFKTLRPAPWTGSGLPPVGTVCEIRAHKLNDWSPATIKFASRNVVVWDWEAEPALNGLCTAYAHAIEIRPIRTPEQIAEEAKEKAIDVIEKRIMDRMGDLNVRNLAEDLFDLLGEMSKQTDQ